MRRELLFPRKLLLVTKYQAHAPIELLFLNFLFLGFKSPPYLSNAIDLHNLLPDNPWP